MSFKAGKLRAWYTRDRRPSMRRDGLAGESCPRSDRSLLTAGRRVVPSSGASSSRDTAETTETVWRETPMGRVACL